MLKASGPLDIALTVITAVVLLFYSRETWALKKKKKKKKKKCVPRFAVDAKKPRSERYRNINCCEERYLLGQN